MVGILGVGIDKSSVKRAVKAVAEKVPRLKKEELKEMRYQASAVGADITSIRYNGQSIPVSIIVDETNGIVLSIDELPGEDTEQLKAWLAPILEAVDADVLVTDDACAFKKISDETKHSHQVCKSNVARNTDALVEELSTIILSGQEHSLGAIGIPPE